MAKITSLGRVAGSRWYTGTNYNEIKLPLDGDLFMNEETSKVYKYENKQWVLSLEFEPAVVKNYVDKVMNGYILKEDKVIKINTNNFIVNAAKEINLNGIVKANGKKVITENEMDQIVTINNDQTVNSVKTFNKPIIMIGDDINGKIYPSINDKGSIGSPSNHFKNSYINTLNSNIILPISRNEVTNSSSVGSIGTSGFKWLNAYIDNISSKVINANILKEGGVLLENKYLTEEKISHKADKLDLEIHIQDKSNPHNVTKEQLGLGDLDSTLEALENKIDELIQNKDVLETLLDNYYNKDETLNLLSPKANITYVDDGLSSVLTNSKAYTNQKVANLVNSAPEALDTLGELANALENHKDAYDALLEEVGKKAYRAELNTHITNYNNPHNVTIDQIEGLRDALDKGDNDEDLQNHTTNYNNPHKVTASQVDAYTKKEVDDLLDNLNSDFGTDLDNYYTKKETDDKFVPFNYYTAGDGIAISDDGVISLNVEYAEEGSY